MKVPCEIISNIFATIKPQMIPGVKSKDLDLYIGQLIRNSGSFSAPIEKGFPGNACISVNNIVCHGVPDEYIFQEGDIVSVDISIRHGKYYGDSCVTFPIGAISEKRKKLLMATYESMWNGIQILKSGVYTGDIGYICEKTALKFGYQTIRDFAGHGIGKQLHMPPEILFFGTPNTGKRLHTDMYITIEPMVAEHSYEIDIANDNWTAYTVDGGDCAQFEHTIRVTDSGFEVMTYNFFDKLNNKPRILGN